MQIKDLKLDKKYSGVIVEFDKDLTGYSTLQLKGRGNVITVSDRKSLQSVVKDLFQSNILYRVLGKGSNILIDEWSEEPYIKIDFVFDKGIFNNNLNTFTIPASVPLNLLTAVAIKNGFSGWEVFTGIPASLGGAIAMNAGTSLGEISNIVDSVTTIRSDGEVSIRKLNKKDFSYRANHFLSPGEIIIEATLFHHGLSSEIPSLIKNYLQKRSDSQPLTKKTCGCTFKNRVVKEDKNLETCRAGQFIDMIGLKGFEYKSLRVSPTHANFIENMGGATKQGFLELIEIINNEVDKNAGFKFETEVVSFN